MRRVLITGAAAGLGRALALACRDAGDNVTAVDRDETALATLSGLETLTCDLCAPDAATRIAEACAPDTSLILHCAGISATGPFEDIPAEVHARVLRVNLVAPIQITRALLASDRLAPDATHAFVGSLSTFTGYPGATSYAASKDGLASFARSLHKAGHRSTCIFPGPLRTNHAARYAPDNSDKTVAARMAPEDAAALILRDLARGRRTIIPGAKAKAFAAAGRLLPGPTGRALRKALYEAIDTPKV
ncbi:MAG: SDR family NAD(P)-dependent oxidoreductase [Pseudomonadota bacterium]